MKTIINFLIKTLVFVSCTQWFGVFFKAYFFIDELILTMLFVCLFSYSKKIILSKITIVLSITFIILISISSIINFYSLEAFVIKSTYYIKSFAPFLILPFFSKNIISKGTINFILVLLFASSIFSFYEFYTLNNNIWSFGYNWPFKLRNGFYRAQALTGHPISLGVLNFMAIVIIKETTSINKKYILIFIISLLLTFSRIPILLSVLYFFYTNRNLKLLIVKRQFFPLKWLYFSLIPIIVLFTAFVIPNYLESVNEKSTTRVIVASKVPQIFKNPKNIFFGTGIGSFGMKPSVENKSEVYTNIDFPKEYLQVIKNNSATGIESFFIMTLVEFGILGYLISIFILLGIDTLKMKPLKLFLFLSLLIFSITYPLYSFPAVFLFPIFFPNFNPR